MRAICGCLLLDQSQQVFYGQRPARGGTKLYGMEAQPRRDDTSPVVVGWLDKGVKRKYPSPFLPLVSLARSNPCLVLEENHPSTPLIRARTANSQSSAATRLLLVGLLGRRYYPCGSFAMSFYGKLIDGAENCTGERLTY